MCWDEKKPPKPSEDDTDYDDEPIDTDDDDEPVEPTVPCAEQLFGPEEIHERITQTITNAPPENEAWNNTFEWDSKFTLDISRLNCSITVTVKIRVTGTISDQQLDDWQSAIETKWNNKVTMECPDSSCADACPGGYSVWVDVQFVGSGEHYDVAAQTADPTPGGTFGLNGTTDMTGWGVTDLVDITHEFGHMLGNTEEYFTTDGVDWTEGGTKEPFRDPDGAIMNNPANDPVPRNYSLIAEKSIPRCYESPYPETGKPGFIDPLADL